MNSNDATRIIDVIDSRVRALTKSVSRVETTWGTVDSVSSDNRTVSVMLYGETDSAYASQDFRTVNGVVPVVGDSVKVAIDTERGDRWVEEVYQSATYNRLEFDHTNGVLSFGPGSSSPDVNLYRAASNLLKTDDTFHAVGGLRVTSPSSTDGQNFEGVRIVLPNNGYTGLAIYAGPTDAQPAFKWAGYGAMLFGPGGATAPDTNLYRSAADTLATDDKLIILGGTDVSLTSTDHGLQIGASSGSNIAMDNNEIMARNNGVKSVLHINADGGQVSIGYNAAGTTSADGLIFGQDTVLFRRAANSLQTDDVLYVNHNSGIVTITTANIAFRNFLADGDTQASFYISSAGALNWGAGGTTAVDVSLSRTAANQLSLGSGDTLAVNGTQVITSRRTGWGAPTGTATRTSFATDTVTLINLARAVKALIDDLTTHGLIGA